MIRNKLKYMSLQYYNLRYYKIFQRRFSVKKLIHLQVCKEIKSNSNYFLAVIFLP